MPQLSDLTANQQHCLARALYDNDPDSPDELAFRRGDTLVVLEQNTNNIEGWWLCTLRGRQGICPANRLRLIAGVFKDTGQSRVASPQFTDVQNQDFHYGKRRSWQVHTNQVVTPKKCNDVFMYDIPPSVGSPSPNICRDIYDVPPRAVAVGNESFRNCPRCSPLCVSPIQQDSYDVPRPFQGHPNQLTPSSSASSLTADSLSSSNRSSLINMTSDYDVPRSHNRGPQLVLAAAQQTYDTPTPQSTVKELPLELNSALETLERLQTDTTSAITKLQSFVGPKWRTKEKLRNNILEIKLSAIRLGTSLHDLADFGEGTLGNASRATDKNLAGKLSPMVSAIRKSCAIVQDVSEKLNRHSWSLDVLARPDDEEKICKPDELEQLVACTRALTEDIRQIASFIQGNGLLLFKRDPSQSSSEWTEDYDYVSLDSKENIAKKHADILKQLPKELKKGYEDCMKHANDVAFDGDFKGLDSDDRQLVMFYAAQAVTHHTNLTQAIDAFLQTVASNQPPKLFLAHGKFVVLSAHKLVLIGDTVHRNVSCREIKDRALNCANSLIEALAASVNKTKQAALQFPSVTAVQEMVDSVVDISHAAKALKVCLIQAANPI